MSIKYQKLTIDSSPSEYEVHSIEASPCIEEKEQKVGKVKRFNISPENRDKNEVKLISSITDIMENIPYVSSWTHIPDDKLTVFDTFYPCTYPIAEYIQYIMNHSHLSFEGLVNATIYMRKFCDCQDIELTSLNVHKLVLVACLVSSKFIDDVYLSNKIMANFGGIPAKELNDLEIEFLSTIKYDLYVPQDEYEHTLECISSFRKNDFSPVRLS
jgi:Cyclin.